MSSKGAKEELEEAVARYDEVKETCASQLSIWKNFAGTKTETDSRNKIEFRNPKGTRFPQSVIKNNSNFPTHTRHVCELGVCVRVCLF
jgi:hypothetical protein